MEMTQNMKTMQQFRKRGLSGPQSQKLEEEVVVLRLLTLAPRSPLVPGRAGADFLAD